MTASRTHAGPLRWGRRGPPVSRAARLSFSAALLVLLAGGCDPAPSGPSPDELRARLREHPARNLLLITLDTTRADALGAYGQELPASPHLDYLARRGVLFEQVSASAPTTVPSHASILTGLHPFAHGARANSGYVLADRNRTLAEILDERGFRTAAEVAAPVIGRRKGLDQGFDHFRDLASFDAESNRVIYRDETGAVALELPERSAADVTRHALAFLREQTGEEPFFLWLHYYDPHVLHAPPEAFRLRIPTSDYLAEVLYVDHQIGRVVQELQSRSLAEQTLVVVTADHGEGFGQHGERSHSFFVYESTIRIPLILWGPPGLPAGKRVTSHVRSIDILPTALELLGLEPPAEVHGRSLVPLITGESEDLELVAYGETLDGHSAFGTSVLRYVREGDWKYIHKVAPELYDVGEDPVEQHDLASRRPEVVERLRARLDALLTDARERGGDGAVALDSEALAELTALGYVAAPAPDVEDTLAVSGLDPRETLSAIHRLGRAHGAYKMGRYELALELFTGLDEEFPDRVPVLAGWIDTLRALERDDEAIPLLRRSLAVAPDFVPHRVLLARLLRERGGAEEAEGLLRRAVEVAPCSVEARVTLGGLLAATGRPAAQIELLEAGVERCPDEAGLRNDLAYALATSPRDDLRDGERALDLIGSVVRSELGENPIYFDTLAAACAEVGDFECAAEAAREALRLLEHGGRDLPPEALAEFRRTLATVEAGRAVRSSP